MQMKLYLNLDTNQLKPMTLSRHDLESIVEVRNILILVNLYSCYIIRAEKVIIFDENGQTLWKYFTHKRHFL